MSKRDVKKILILRFSSLGDIVMTTAAIRCLRKRFPTAQIDMVVRQEYLDLIRWNPHLDQKIGLERNSGMGGLLKLLRQINREGYDLVYDAHRSLRTRLLMPFIRSGSKAYFSKHYLRRALALTFKFPILHEDRFLQRFIEPLEKFGVRYDVLGPEVFVDEEATKRAAEKMEGENWVGIIASAQWPGKRWPWEKFAELIRILGSQKDFRFVLFGGKEDTFCADIEKASGNARILNTQGKLSILEAASCLKRCRFVIANDTGLMHVADGVLVPSVLIFGPTSGDLGCLPFHPLTEVAEKKLWCRPCSKNGEAPCIRGRRVCLLSITPEEVAAKALRVYERVEKISR